MTEDSLEALKEYGRGITGGLIFSLPLLYTMEMWWRGFTAEPVYLLCYIIAIYLLLLGYNRYAGMRKDASFLGIMWDSVEELGLAVIVSFLFLLLIGKINPEMSVIEVVGKVVTESMMVAIGISVGTSQLGQSNERGSGKRNSKASGDKKENELAKALVLSACGAVLISSSVAPTMEILKIAVEVNQLHLVFMVVVSLVIMATVQHYIDFTGTDSEEKELLDIGLHVILEYLVALLVSFGLLYFFGRVTDFSFSIVLAETIVLGIPAALGASAGKLILGSQKQKDDKAQ